jgi:hypothetical protein
MISEDRRPLLQFATRPVPSPQNSCNDKMLGETSNRKYHAWKTTGLLLVSFYAAMAGAALIVEATFWIAGLIPSERNARVVEASVEWNYTTTLPSSFSRPCSCGDS